MDILLGLITEVKYYTKKLILKNNDIESINLINDEDTLVFFDGTNSKYIFDEKIKQLNIEFGTK